MKRFTVFIYGLISYIVFLVSFLYAIGFVGNIIVPKSIDSGVTQPIGMAILINALLLAVFAIQHTIMARPAFKRIWTKIIPEAAERSTFVLLSSLILLLLFWQWRPVGGVVWSIEGGAGELIMNIIFWVGWFIVLSSTYIIDHFELFGLKQVTNYLLKKERKEYEFTDKLYYKWVRHPIMFGFIVAFWAAPTMSYDRLFFAVMTTSYIFVGVKFEEIDLRKHFGITYTDYVDRVPMLIPFLKRNSKKTPPQSEPKHVIQEN